MTSSTDADTIQSLEYISKQINRSLPIIIFVFGTVGNILNCLLLSQRTFRTNPCAILFLVSSFIDLISIVIGVPTRILAGWDLDPTTTIRWICKLRAFTVFSTRTMAIWLISLATIERWLLSSVDIHRRQKSTLKNVYVGIFITIILSILFYVHMLYCYEANLIDSPLKCYGKTDGCRLMTDLTYALVTVMIPLIVMLIFGLMTISNVRHVHLRVHHIGAETIHNHMGEHRDINLRRTDHNLLRMLLVEILCLILLCIPQAVQKFYVSFKPFGSVSDLDDAVKSFLYNIELLLAFIASGMPFYVYTLAGGSIFRKAFMDLIHLIIRKFTCRLH